MTPNLFVATQKVFSPHKWFKKPQHEERPQRRTEHWMEPVPGVYEYIPGRGWYLVATYKSNPSANDSTKDSEGGPVQSTSTTSSSRHPETTPRTPPTPVRYSKVLKKYLLAPDYDARKAYGTITDSRNRAVQVGFFRLDDGTAWVNCWDEEGAFIPGPYKLWCIDARTSEFRHMLRGDDPKYVRSRPSSIRAASSDQLADGQMSRRNSQESRSTQFRVGGAGSEASGASTRASSAMQSKAGSRAGSRRASPTRTAGPLKSPGLVLDEAGSKLRELAMEQAASRAASSRSVEQVKS